MFWRNLHALPKGKANKSDKDDEGEKRDKPVRHCLLLFKAASVGGRFACTPFLIGGTGLFRP
jgi:hypothetical protein